MYHADTNPEETHEGWEAQKGIKNPNPLRAMMDELCVSMEELRSGARTRRLCDARTLLAAALPATQKQLATLFNSTQPAVSAMRKRHAALLKSDPHYRAKWQRITSLKSQV
jgi:hypothetical protein